MVHTCILLWVVTVRGSAVLLAGFVGIVLLVFSLSVMTAIGQISPPCFLNECCMRRLIWVVFFRCFGLSCRILYVPVLFVFSSSLAVVMFSIFSTFMLLILNLATTFVLTAHSSYVC